MKNIIKRKEKEEIIEISSKIKVIEFTNNRGTFDLNIGDKVVARAQLRPISSTINPIKVSGKIIKFTGDAPYTGNK